MIDDGPCTNVRVVKDVSVAEGDVGFDGASLADDGGLDVGVVGDAGVCADERVGADFACTVCWFVGRDIGKGGKGER